MNILLDTHIFLLSVSDPFKLSSKARMLMNSATHIYVSSVSIWEAEVNVNLGKLHVDLQELSSAICKSGFIELPLFSHHILTTKYLKDWRHAPFDRLLVAQAICEPLKLLTTNSILKKYTELVILS